jgi:hypothetical protein
VLDGVLGLLGRAEHVAAERQHAAVVAHVQRLECRLGAAVAQQLDEALVGRQPEQAGVQPAPTRSCVDPVIVAGYRGAHDPHA